MTTPFFLGGCFQTAPSSPVYIKRNVTQMKDYQNPSQYIAPYTLAEFREAPDCSIFNEGSPAYFVCGDGLNGNLYCGPATSDLVRECQPGSSSFDVGTLWNCYATTSLTQSSNACTPHLGFKNVYAKKIWQGRKAYNSSELGMPDTWDWCCSCGAETYKANPDNTKYLKLSASSNIEVNTKVYTVTHTDGGTCDDCPDLPPIYNDCSSITLVSDNTIIANAANIVEVSKFSGNIAVETADSSSTGCYSGTEEDIALCNAYYAMTAFGLLTKADGNVSAILSKWCQTITLYANAGMVPDVVTGAGDSWHVEYHTTKYYQDHCGNPFSEVKILVEMDINTSAGTLSIKKYGEDNNCRESCTCDDCIADWILLHDESYSYGTTDFTYILDVTGEGSWSLDQDYHEDVAGSLSVPYTGDSVKEDVKHLLTYWKLGDDNQLPWRTDERITNGPLMSYDEIQSAPIITTTGSNSNTGEMLGLPAPEGIDKVWIFNRKNYCICDSLVNPGCLSYYVKDYGCWSDSIYTPRATQILSDWEESNVPQGAFLLMNKMWSTPSTCNSSPAAEIYDDIVYACKYAELIFPKKSFNWARPCGEDRFTPKIGSERCISSFTDNVLTLESLGSPTDIITNDYVFVCGTSALDGLWKATKNNDYEIELQEPRLISSSLLPSSPIADCGTGVIVKLRWNLQPAICGTLEITEANNSNPVTCSLNEASYLVNTDQVFITNAKGLTDINGVWTVKVIDNKTVSLVGCNGENKPAYSGSGLMRSPFAADPIWNTNDPKRNYSTVTWQTNYRDIGELSRIELRNDYIITENLCDGSGMCSPMSVPSGLNLDTDVLCQTHIAKFSACGPAVGIFTPTVDMVSESFGDRVINHGFGNPPLDTQYGTLWQGMIRQSMADPLYQAEICPCETIIDENTMIESKECNCQMVEDNGTCQADQSGDEDLGIPCIKYYPATPQVEAVCNVPIGAPSLPSDAYLFCENNSCSPPTFDANEVFDLGVGCDKRTSIPYVTPWTDYLNKYSCVCADGRFADDYRIKENISCNSVVPAP
jgi:hypothetical protein